MGESLKLPGSRFQKNRAGIFVVPVCINLLRKSPQRGCREPQSIASENQVNLIFVGQVNLISVGQVNLIFFRESFFQFCLYFSLNETRLLLIPT